MRGTGTLIDAAVIIMTGVLGLIIGKKINQNLIDTLMKLIGLVCIINGVQMALESSNFLTIFIGILLGTVVGELLQLENKLNSLSPKNKGNNFNKALIAATLISLAGPLAILGPIQEGLNGDLRLIMLKTGFDSISTPILAAGMGAGAIFAVVPVILLQGLLTFLGLIMSSLITGAVMNQLIGVGGIIILALGLKILKIKEFKVVNMLPAFLTVLLITLIMQ
jgi:hypothetical protein